MLLVSTIVLSGCGKKEREAAEQRAQAAEAKVAQLTVVAAAKDSLMDEMIATTSFIGQINDELAKVKPAKGAKTVTYQEKVIPVAEYRTAMLTRVKELTKRLDESEARVRALTSKDRQLTARLAAFDSMIAEYRTMAENQRLQIEQMTTQVATLQADNQKLNTEKTQLTEEKTQLTTQVTDMTITANKAYYVIGSKQELLAKGVAAETGGARFLGIGWKSGKALVPAHDLQETAFVQIGKDTTSVIPLPKTDKKYAIISPQNLQHVEPLPAKDGTFRGSSIRITNPDAFWAQSKFLILLER